MHYESWGVSAEVLKCHGLQCCVALDNEMIRAITSSACSGSLQLLVYRLCIRTFLMASWKRASLERRACSLAVAPNCVRIRAPTNQRTCRL